MHITYAGLALFFLAIGVIFFSPLSILIALVLALVAWNERQPPGGMHGIT